MAEVAIPALIGLAGAGLGASASGEAALVQMMNLQFQRDQALKQQRLATAGRTDAYGNQQVYDPATNSWKTILTPTQNQIIQAGQTEQLKELTTDAARNRQIQEAAHQRGIEAIPDYAKALAGFRYDEAPSRAADEDKLNTLMSLQDQTASGQQAQAIGRTLLRQGRGADLPNVLKAADDAQGRNIGGNLLKSYQASIPQYAQDVAARQSRYLPVLQQLQQTMNAGGSAPPRFSTTPQELNALQSQQAQLVQSALQSGGAGVGNAFSGLAKADESIGSNDIKGLTAVMNAFKSSKSNTPQYGLVPNQSQSDNSSGFSTDDTSSGNDYSNAFSNF